MDLTAPTYLPDIARPDQPKPTAGPVFIGDILNAPLGQPDLIRLWIKDWEHLKR